MELIALAAQVAQLVLGGLDARGIAVTVPRPRVARGAAPCGALLSSRTRLRSSSEIP
jgi:hypothetical protein